MVSINWPNPSDTNRGQRRAREPAGRVEEESTGSMFTALQESSACSQNSSVELARQRKPPSPPKSVSSCRPEAPYCISDQFGAV
jgi:hypothetical protein